MSAWNDFITRAFYPRLMFDRQTEHEFGKKYLLDKLGPRRFLLFAAAILADTLLVLDWIVVPDIMPFMVFVRVGVATGSGALANFVFRDEKYARYWLYCNAGLYFGYMAGLSGAVWISNAPYAFVYLFGLPIVQLAASYHGGQPFRWVLGSSIPGCGVALIATYMLDIPLPVKACAMLLLLAAFIFSLMGAYENEGFARREYQLVAGLEEARDRAIEATKMKDKFVSLVSHDLKSPLTGIIGFAKLINSKTYGGNTGTTLEELTSRLLSSAEAMLRLITQVLDIGRLSTGKIKLRKSQSDLRSLAEAKMSSVAGIASQKGITLVNDIPDGFRLFVDEDLFGEVILNLCSNAVKFCKQGDTIRIFVVDEKAGVIAVADTGAGIPESILPNLFRHDVKTTSIGTAGEKGTGLGLPYCMDIVSAHGGKIRVESAVGAGSTFYIEIPVPKGIVLIVDDQEAHINIMSSLIEKHFAGIAVVSAEDGFAALDELTSVHPTLIITDLHMPNMDGWKLIETVAARDNFKSIPVIVASSIGSFDSPGGTSSDIAEVMARTKTLGAAGFISKPVVESEFVTLLRGFF